MKVLENVLDNKGFSWFFLFNFTSFKIGKKIYKMFNLTKSECRDFVGSV